MPVKDKIRRDAFDYLPWAGVSVDPVLDPELFAKLPGWRQRERLFIRKMVETRTPFTLDDVLRAGIGEEVESIEVSLPSSLTLDSLLSRSVGTTSGSMMGDLDAAVTKGNILSHCTALGEGRQLLNEKPAHGLYAYLWALVLVRKKALSSLPLPYFWELDEGIHKVTGKTINSRVPDAAQLLSWLDRKAQLLAANVS